MCAMSARAESEVQEEGAMLVGRSAANMGLEVMVEGVRTSTHGISNSVNISVQNALALPIPKLPL